MVAKITTGKSIRGMLHYNENKVTAGEACLILSSGFAVDIDQLNFNQKLQRFQHLTELKPNVKTNAVHISLNFHSSEKLDNLKLQQIANRYMESIGFGDQPFLVYRHDDAAHQHLHITTTNITANGVRIDLHDIGKRLSELARKEIEIEYGLVKAESKQAKQEAGIKPADLEKAYYGTLPTKRAISNVVTAVTRDYKFTSLAEYNAILKCFNVVAFRGAEHTAMFEKKGLMFSMLDKKGNQVGVPIKSSAFYSKPTLRNLEKKFEANVEKRKGFKDDLKVRIDKIIGNRAGISKKAFEEGAKELGIEVSYRENAAGPIFGITFVDHINKVVFNGSDLGKAHSAKAITGRFTAKDIGLKPEHKTELKTGKSTRMIKYQRGESVFILPKTPKLIELVLAKTSAESGIKIPKRRKKRKKKQRITQELNL
ncbi:relaxase [Pedobacter ginsengisoli]|uniref:Relaxase n=1 Tax=Pedobacter ginsengisoli TaxID=363852 RepID=A0A2D1U1R8_9SPHI|nr:relaxase/mobilization nuclease domain-containing protein [Pedobacter ginsengisoli]ATP55539.1 relaxase [Pedobacter ginsengisoli]